MAWIYFMSLKIGVLGAWAQAWLCLWDLLGQAMGVLPPDGIKALHYKIKAMSYCFQCLPQEWVAVSKPSTFLLSVLWPTSPSASLLC